MSKFANQVYKIVAKIPKGKVMSYGAVALLAGSPRAARVVGTLMRLNPYKSVPCHRVIRADGKVGNYSFGGLKKKIRLLVAEGVKIKGDKVII